jgi:protein gp37
VDPDHLEPDDCLRPYLPGLRQLLRADTGQAPEGHGLAKYQNDGDPRTSGPGFAVTCHEDVLTKPLSWRRPRTVFVNSMSDVGHARVPVEFVARIWAVMALTPQHTYQLLTKRPGRLAAMLSQERFRAGLVRDVIREYLAARPDLGRNFADLPCGPFTWPVPNAWIGTSIESDKYVSRADALRAAPAATRFLSLEPLLGPLPSLDLTGINWVIAGGESGRGHRPVNLDWIRDLDGRPPWPAGVSTSVATLRRTLSLASACLIARVSPACAWPPSGWRGWPPALSAPTGR